MATETEKLIGNLAVEVATLKAQTVALRREFDVLIETPTRLALVERYLAAMQVEVQKYQGLATELPLVRSDVAELKEARRRGEDRRWAAQLSGVVALIGLIGVILGVVLAAVLGVR